MVHFVSRDEGWGVRYGASVSRIKLLNACFRQVTSRLSPGIFYERNRVPLMPSLKFRAIGPGCDLGVNHQMSGTRPVDPSKEDAVALAQLI